MKILAQVLKCGIELIIEVYEYMESFMAVLKRFNVLVVLCVCLFCSQIFAVDTTGFQFKTTTSLSTDLSTLWKVKFEEEIKYAADEGEVFYNHSDLGFIYSGFADWLDVGLNIRLITSKGSSDKWTQETRPHVNFTIKDKIGDIAFSTRSRFEFRDRYQKEDTWRYRNKFTFKLPYELTELKLRPYVADEVFINMNEEGYSANRVYAGFSFNITKKIKGDLYYQWQSARANPGRDDTHTLGTKISFSF